jgi:type IV pilus assembly protein PilO
VKKISLNVALSLNARLWIFFAGCLAAVGGLVYLFYTQQFRAYFQESRRLEAGITEQKGQLRQILAQKQRLKDLEAEIEQANLEFARLQEMFPDKEVIPRRLIDLTTVTRRSATLPTKFLPLQSEDKEFYRENHYSVTLSSSFHGLGTLFSEVANFRYPTAIGKLQIARVESLDTVLATARDHGEIPRTVTTSFELTTFTSKR